MAKFQIAKGEASVILTVFIQDSSKTTGEGLGSLDEGSSIVGGYVKRNGTGVALAVDQNVATEGTYEAPSTAAQVRIGTPANMPTGFYELHFHDDLFTAADWVTIGLGGASNMAELPIEVQLVTNDPNTAGVTLRDNAITAGKYDESSAFPLVAADSGATQVARVGADGDTLEGLSGQIDSIPTTPMRGTDGANTVAPLDAGGIRSAVGLASDNLDTQIGNIPTTPMRGTDGANTEAMRGTDSASTHNAAAVWSASGRELSTPGNYKADVSGLSTHNAAAVWAAANRALSTPNDYKATGFSTHNAAAVKTAMEADGSKLDHVWEMTEDDAGTRRLTTNALEQAPNTIVGITLADGAITAAKIASDAITAAKIATDAITAAKIAANAIGSSELATTAIQEIARAINLPKNAAFSNLEFEMFDSTNHNPATGKTVTGQRSIDGSEYAGVSGSITEVGNGTYQFDAEAADMNGDFITFRFSNADTDDTFMHVKTAA